MEAVSTLAAVEERILRGDALSAADAAAILDAKDIIHVGALADGARRRRHGVRTTFVRVFEMHVDATAAALPARVSAGEVRIIGAPRDVGSAVAAVRAAAGAAAAVPLTGFSLADLVALCGPASALQSLCARLAEAGLRAVAEAPVDRLDNAAAAVAAARAGGLSVLRMTVHDMTADTRTSLLRRARSLQADVGGFRALAPLPRTMSVALPTTGYDDVKLVALARLMADNIESIQVDWPLYGPKLAQVALTVGADDVDGIAAVESGTLGTRRSAIEEITGNIRAAMLEPAERDGLFEQRRIIAETAERAENT
jgi:aminodeoxyfutalosine synthase